MYAEICGFDPFWNIYLIRWWYTVYQRPFFTFNIYFHSYKSQNFYTSKQYWVWLFGNSPPLSRVRQSCVVTLVTHWRGQIIAILSGSGCGRCPFLLFISPEGFSRYTTFTRGRMKKGNRIVHKNEQKLIYICGEWFRKLVSAPLIFLLTVVFF